METLQWGQHILQEDHQRSVMWRWGEKYSEVMVALPASLHSVLEKSNCCTKYVYSVRMTAVTGSTGSRFRPFYL